MNGDDDLRALLAETDPLRDGSTTAQRPTATALEIEERVMQVLLDESATADSPDPRRTRRLRVLACAAAVAVVTAAGVTAGLVMSDRDETPRSATATTLALAAAPGGVMASCLPFDVSVLAGMPVAFAGTVAAVNADSVTLDVDRWYTGGSEEQVRVSTPAGETSVALDGVAFADGQRYLVTATNGTVNGCGFSGPATPEMEQAFAQAFGG